MPEAAIDEDSDFLAFVRDVGSPRNASVMLSVSLTEIPEPPSDDKFRDCVLPSYACHDPAARLFSEVVSHVERVWQVYLRL